MTNAPSGANLRGAVDLSSLVRPPAPTAEATQAATSGGAVRVATDATFTDVLDLSSTVPVIVEFHGAGVAGELQRLITQYGGRVALAIVDGTTNPQLVQAFQVQQVPTVAAVIGGRPIQLFSGTLPEAELREVIEQVLQLAAQNGVVGVIPLGEATVAGADSSEPVEEPLPPHHQEAFDAIEEGDFATAITEYETAIAQNPRDQLAVAGLAQVRLLARLATTPPTEVLDGAATDSISGASTLDRVLASADRDIAAGRFDEGLARLLEVFPALDVDGKTVARVRLLEYFEIIGAEDPAVVASRRRLTTLLY